MNAGRGALDWAVENSIPQGGWWASAKPQGLLLALANAAPFPPRPAHHSVAGSEPAALPVRHGQRRLTRANAARFPPPNVEDFP